MIGFKSILADLIFPLGLGIFFLLFAAHGLNGGRSQRSTHILNKNDIDHSNVLTFMLVFSLVWLGFFANRVLREADLHSSLRRLRAQSVDHIEIGTQSVTDKKQIAAIISVLNRPEWYSLQHGDAGDELPFVIKLNDGTEYTYEIRRYLRGEGAALVSHSSSGLDNGEVYCRRLPALLAKAGVTLPPCSSYPTKARNCVTP